MISSEQNEAFKNSVAQKFSKAAQTYDTYGHIQKQVAEKLTGYLPALPENPTILEIGCGTGCLTGEVIKKYPTAALTLNDISANMLEKCREKYPEDEKTRYLLGDAESFDFATDYDLIVSNLTFQWFSSPETALPDLKKKFLTENGFLLFSSLGEHTFVEWFESLKEAGASVMSNFSYQSPPALNYRFYERFRLESAYESGTAFLSAIKRTGAYAARTQKPLTRDVIERAAKIFEKKYNAIAAYDVIIAVL